MWKVLRRVIVPMLLTAGGVAALVYGVWFHRIPVLVEQETPTTIEVPLPLPGPPPDEAFSPNGPPSFPGGPPTFIKKTVMRVDVVTDMASEYQMTQDVSVGGVARLATGEVKRTYSGKGPSLCPS